MELTPEQIAQGIFLDANGVPTNPDGTPLPGWSYEGTRGGGPSGGPSGGILGAIGQQVNVPEWQVQQPAPVDDGRGGGPTEQPLSEQQRALLGQFGEAGREQAGTSLLNYIGSSAGADPGGPEAQSQSLRPPMTETAEAFMDRQRFPIDPNRIGFNGTSFVLDGLGGPDLFGGQLPADFNLNLLPRSLQPLLGPAIAQYFGLSQDLVARGGAPPWSRFFAPPVGQGPIDPEHGWPGTTHYDAWHRSLGAWPALYS